MCSSDFKRISDAFLSLQNTFRGMESAFYHPLKQIRQCWGNYTEELKENFLQLLRYTGQLVPLKEGFYCIPSLLAKSDLQPRRPSPIFASEKPNVGRFFFLPRMSQRAFGSLLSNIYTVVEYTTIGDFKWKIHSVQQFVIEISLHSDNAETTVGFARLDFDFGSSAVVLYVWEDECTSHCLFCSLSEELQQIIDREPAFYCDDDSTSAFVSS